MLLRSTLCRDTAPLPFSYICYRDYDSSTYINCTAITPTPNKHYAMTAKTRAIPGLHRDYFPAKVPRHCPDAAPGNTTSLYCRAVRFHSLRKSLHLLFRYFIMIKKNRPLIETPPSINFCVTRPASTFTTCI
jgi:hypothetical protein